VVSLTDIKSIGKTISVHQPHFSPWLPYLWKMNISDEFILADDFRFSQGRDQNSFRLSGVNGVYATAVPLILDESKSLNRATIKDKDFNLKKIVKTIEGTYGKNNDTAKAVSAIRTGMQTYEIFSSICEYIIKQAQDTLFHRTTRMLKTSEMFLSSKGSDRILDICLLRKAKCIIVGAHGADYMRIADFKNKGVRVFSMDFVWVSYPQKYPSPLVPGLSFIDFLWSGTDATAFCDRQCSFTELEA